jgi:hypothetical protein
MKTKREVLGDILKVTVNMRMTHFQRSLFDAVLAKIATHQPLKSDPAQGWTRTDVNNAFRRWVMTGRLHSALECLGQMRSSPKSGAAD